MIYDKEKGQYAPDQIPNVIQKTLYTHYCIGGSEWNIGKLKTYDFSMSGEEYIVVAETQVTIHIPPPEDMKKKVIDALEEEKKKQMALHHKKMFELQEKIDSLLCLTYQSSPVIEETANDVPF